MHQAGKKLPLSFENQSFLYLFVISYFLFISFYCCRFYILFFVKYFSFFYSIIFTFITENSTYSFFLQRNLTIFHYYTVKGTHFLQQHLNKSEFAISSVKTFVTWSIICDVHTASTYITYMLCARRLEQFKISFVLIKRIVNIQQNIFKTNI